MNVMNTTVSGWGLTPSARTHLVTAESADDLRSTLHEAGTRGVAPRGLGRSYGDAAQRTNGTTLQFRSPEQPVWLDDASGLARVPASATIGDLITFGDPLGWFPQVTPGTRHVTVGGAIAADIHGKDQHVAGSFGRHVHRFSLLLADGSVRSVDRNTDADLFNATVGGMGLTGIVLDADISLHKVSGNRILVETFRTADLEATMHAMTVAESSYRYSVAWIDLMARGRSLGRGVVTNGNHTTATEAGDPLGRPLAAVPLRWPLGLVNRPGVKAFNEAWFRRAPAKPKETVESYDSFFYPLDAVDNWNRLYGHRGFLQYQFVIPFEAEDQLPDMVTRLSASGMPIFLAVLKRFGHRGEGFLSFPMPGWTLAMDIPVPSDSRQLETLLRELDTTVVDHGGRLYFAKDSRMGRSLVPTMYPHLAEFRSVRDRVDPERRLQTDLAMRVGL